MTAIDYIFTVIEFISPWSAILSVTGLALSLTVNAVVTGLIVFKILRVFLEVKSATVIGGRNLRTVIFVLIESGTALFSIQMARLVATIVYEWMGSGYDCSEAMIFIIAIHEILNVIIGSIIVTYYFTDNSSLGLGYNTYNHPGAGVDGTFFPRREFPGGTC